MAKWQKPYLDVPADDYLTSEDYICSMGYSMDWVPPLYDLIGPHENRYINLMKLGHKPISLIHDWELKYWTSEIEKYGWVINTLTFQTTSGRIINEFVVCLPDQAWRVDRIKRIYHTRVSRGMLTELEEARIGFLLGYSKQCISAYLERSRLLKAGDYHGANAPHLNFIGKGLQKC